MTQSELDRCARAVKDAVDGMFYAQHLTESGDTFKAREAEDAANESAQQALRLLIASGAHVEDLPARQAAPLHLLNTPAARRLLDALNYAADCAAAVDRERGWVLKDGSPCGWTDAVGDVYERLRREVEGPRGRGEG